MSFFYLYPVKGEMPVHMLEIIVTKRLEYLKSIFNSDSAEYNEYVVEGSIYDNVGHFMLCIVTILSQNIGLTQFFLSTEVELFKRRLDCLSPTDMRCLSKKILRSLKKLDETPFNLEPLQVLCQHLLLKDIAQHICSPLHFFDCFAHIISLNFRHCLTFIAKRQVELVNGIVTLPCGKWRKYFAHLYKLNLKQKISETNLYSNSLHSLKSDPRILEILVKVRNVMLPYISHKSSTTTLLCKDVDNLSKKFPPCMVNLHQSLRKKHRLSHYERFYYSLFLKDIGMPVNEAIDFWKKEYSQTPCGSHSCCHNWDKNEKKYLYGIRHMYGLEGGRKSYTSVNCKRIQNADASCSEGGCPFKSFDNSKMVQVLKCYKRCPDPVLLKINELKKEKQYTSACLLYLQQCVNNSICDNDSFNFNPVKYYEVASKKSVNT